MHELRMITDELKFLPVYCCRLKESCPICTIFPFLFLYLNTAMVKKIPGIILISCLLLVCCSSLAQMQKKYLFTRFGKINGLAADLAFNVAQDSQGFIWIGTDRGLQRYDGKRFITLKKRLVILTALPPRC